MATPTDERGGTTDTLNTPLEAKPRLMRLALLGNPNTGKTTLFNRLCGMRSKTANFPGSTVEARIGSRAQGAFHFERIIAGKASQKRIGYCLVVVPARTYPDCTCFSPRG